MKRDHDFTVGRHMERLTAFLLSVTVLSGGIMPVYAEQIGESRRQETEAVYVQAADYRVGIPKTVTLGADKQAAYSVRVEGDIAYDQKVYVSPVDGIAETEEADFYMQDQAEGSTKPDAVAVITHKKIYWDSEEVAGGFEEKGNVIAVTGVSAGRWKGTFQFEIRLERDMSLHRHSYTETVTREPTCTEAGEKTYVCDCGDSHTEEIPAAGHSYVDGTCTECGEKDPDHAHSYTEAMTKEPTCTEEGEKTYTCPCGDSYTEAVPPAHHYVDGTCTGCGDVLEKYTITFSPNGGECDAETKMVYADLPVGELPVPYMPCHKFDGWRYPKEETIAFTPQTVSVTHTANTNPSKQVTDKSDTVTQEITVTEKTRVKFLVRGTAVHKSGKNFAGANALCAGPNPHLDIRDSQGEIISCEDSSSGYVTDTATNVTTETYKTYVLEPGTYTTEFYTVQGCVYCVYAHTDQGSATVSLQECRKYTEVVADTPYLFGRDMELGAEWLFSGHTFEKEIIKEASCLEKGKESCKCTECGYSCTETIPELGHHFSDGVCINCGQEDTGTGLFDSEGNLQYTWKDLTEYYGMKVDKNYTDTTYATDTQSPSYVFNKYGMKGILILGGDVTSVGNYAFYNCTALTDVELSDSVTSIGSSAFSGCTELGSISIPESVTSIGSSAFRDCTALTDITVPGASVGTYAFYGCSRLGSVEITGSAVVIGNNTFQGCRELENVRITGNVSSIGQYAFNGCTGLKEMEFPEGLSSICDSAFSGCTGLTRIVLPESLSRIEGGAFSRCTGLTSVYIPLGVTVMGGDRSYTNSPFCDCASTLKIYCGASAKQSGWGNYWNYYASNRALTAAFDTTREEYQNLLLSVASLLSDSGMTDAEAASVYVEGYTDTRRADADMQDENGSTALIEITDDGTGSIISEK